MLAQSSEEGGDFDGNAAEHVMAHLTDEHARLDVNAALFA